ncbi:hypothetical protein ACPF8X_41780, partial [Streptomyces sp. G35A]
MHHLGGFYAEPRPFLPGDFVTTDSGTGLVHMAPDHGEDDFVLCKAHGLSPKFVVEADGRYRDDWAWLGGDDERRMSVINPKFNAPDGPICSDLREAGALGLAGPRERLTGLARAVLAQLAALHSPDTLEIVLLAADPSRPVEERTADWSWLGWLPHVRPGHGQDCRLLLAYDREQAAARTGELLRRLEDHDHTAGTGGARLIPEQGAPGGRRPSWAVPDDGGTG